MPEDKAPSTNPLSWLGDVAKTLADGVKARPAFAAICLLVVLLVGAVTATSAPGAVVVIAVALVAIVSIGGVVFLEARNPSSASAARGSSTLTALDATLPIGSQARGDLVALLPKAAAECAGVLAVPPDNVRANVFSLAPDGMLRIPKGITYNMKAGPELTVEMPPGYGSAGRCFGKGTPYAAAFGVNWGDAVLADSETAKLDRDLRWVVSLPVFADPAGTVADAVLNLDGLHDERSLDELNDAAKQLFGWGSAAGDVLRSAMAKKEE